ncbi:hypothetical protein BUALT_Bualt02G0080100 [Buddleja alternifolia]|uniref:Uncharacterized protein n=1 Tax=Buddleja alternifolia TaxID=168488 RepID=A0AAV6Y9I7_9LAMI|nr:hypothetical protein BUALT_Bualt02G0080100 [Buddleja alternifolia]
MCLELPASRKINLGKLYECIGFNKEIISKGRYAELAAAEQRPFRADEAELFAKRAQDMYERFRNKAAFSRSMTVCYSVSNFTLDIFELFDIQVNLVEVSRPSPSLLEILSNMGNSIIEADEAVKELVDEMASFDDAIQARMDGILFQKFDGTAPSLANYVFNLIKDYLSYTLIVCFNGEALFLFLVLVFVWRLFLGLGNGM